MSFFRLAVLALGTALFPFFFVNATGKSADYELDYDSQTTLSDQFISPDYILQSGLTPLSGISSSSETISYFDNCGNNIRNQGEACDRSDVNGFTCQDFGFQYGNLLCSSDCQKILTESCFNSSDRKENTVSQQEVFFLKKDSQKNDIPRIERETPETEIKIPFTREILTVIPEKSSQEEKIIPFPQKTKKDDDFPSISFPKDFSFSKGRSPLSLTIFPPRDTVSWCGKTAQLARVVGIFAGGEKCETIADQKGEFCCQVSTENAVPRHFFSFSEGKRTEIRVSELPENLHAAGTDQQKSPCDSLALHYFLFALVLFFLGIGLGRFFGKKYD